jgi:AraC family transcriptional regulator
MELVGVGRVVFWEGGSLWFALLAAANNWHSHHAIQLCLPVDAEAQFQTEEGGDWHRYAGAIITPDVPHGFRAPGKVVANILFEPESVVGRGVLSQYTTAGLHELPSEAVARLVSPIAAAYFDGADDAELIALARHAVASISGVANQSAPTDPRVLEAIADIRRHIDEPILLPRLARRVGLSAGRLRHLFVAETGVSFRAFVLWERLNRALALGFEGTSWTEAAHAANFADSAHLTRTCRRMFGLAPSSARVELPDSEKRLTA